MQLKFTEFGSLLIEVVIAFALIHWIWGDELLKYMVVSVVVAMLARIMFLLEKVVSGK